MGLRSLTARRAHFPVAALFAMALAGCGEAGKEFDDSYRDRFVDSFVKSCQSSATQSGAPAELASTVCRCAADELVARHSPAELLALTDDKALPVMKDCAQKAGLAV